MAQEQIVRILLIEEVTHDVKRFIVEKPEGFTFIPGHSCLISINTQELRDEKREFSFTSTNEDLALEFHIKRYDEHDGITKKMHLLKPGDELIIADVFGTVRYKGSPGVWIAAGAGLTPFLGIFRQLKKEGRLSGNKLIYSNKLHKDIINEQELIQLFEKDLVLVLTREKKESYQYGRISQELIKKHIKDFSCDFYICGPDQFVSDIKKILSGLKANADVLSF